jgi:hypothetical protein
MSLVSTVEGDQPSNGVDATYLTCGPDELRRKAAEGDDRALVELGRAA